MRWPEPTEIVPYDAEHLPAVNALAREALDLPEDVAEAGAVVDRLLSPPVGRPVVRLLASDAGGVVVGLGFGSIGSPDATVGHLDLIAVAPAARRRGIAARLVSAIEEALAGLGASEVRIAGNAPCYGWPGIDVRYTPAVCLALARGYAHVRTAWNMTVDLATVEDPAGAQAQLATAGVTVRPAVPADVAAVREFATRHFGGDRWPWELEQSISRAAGGAVAGCHLAVRGDELLGFAAFGALRASLFGPMGTAPAAQGMGIGGVLLRRCLLEQRAAGLATAQIGWAGPVAFYSDAVGARIGRVFFMYRKPVGKGRGPEEM